jgi:hypothetical protein
VKRLVLVAALAGGCSTQWTRPDYSPAQAAQDQLACEEQAEREASLRPVGFHGGSLSQYYGPNYQPYGRTRWIGAPGPMFDADPAGSRMMEEGRLVDSCMRAKGYVPKN